jgi:hypothetical protein
MFGLSTDRRLHLSGGCRGMSSEEDSKIRPVLSQLGSMQRKGFPGRFILARGTA